MGVRLTSQERVVALFDSTTGTAFGPVFDEEEEAEQFLEWSRESANIRDVRLLSGAELEELYSNYLRELWEAKS